MDQPSEDKPTIVLAHGVWADGSGTWDKVIPILRSGGYTALAPAVSLASLSADIGIVRKFVTDLKTPVLLVGHSYGGAVISGAAAGLSNVVGLVYLAAFALDQNESVLSQNTQFEKDYGPALAGQYLRPDGPFEDPKTYLYFDREHFGEAFAQDVPKAQTAVMAATQRPICVAAFGEPLQVTPAWRTIKSWYQVSAQDHVIQPEGERWLAKRMGAETIELKSSHASPVADPAGVAKLIAKAAVASAN